MTEWIDVIVYAAFMCIIWFALPAVNARFIVPIIEDRHSGWLAAHPEAARQVTRRGWLHWGSYVLGTLSIATLIAAQTGVWPDALSEPRFEPQRWMVLSNVFTAFVLLWVSYFAAGSVVFTRWLNTHVPLSERRQATLERRSVATFVPRPLRVAVHAALAVHLAAWLIVGVLGTHSDAFGGMLAFQVVVTVILVFIAHRMAERRPSAMDRIFGAAFRRTEVLFAFVAQLLVLVNGSLRLYEEVTGTVPLDLDRAARLFLVLFMIGGVAVGLFRFTWSSRLVCNHRSVGGTGHAL
jgi:hypothetical protein